MLHFSVDQVYLILYKVMSKTLFCLNDFFSGSLDWRWIDGFKIDFSYWNKGQPDSNDQADYCALSWWSGGQADGHWDDQPCSEISHAFICQKEKSMYQFHYYCDFTQN